MLWNYIDYWSGLRSKIQFHRDVCERLMTKYNRKDLAPLLNKYPYWSPESLFAFWQSNINNYNEVSDSYNVIPNKIYKLIEQEYREDGTWRQKSFKSFDVAMIQYFKALKKFIKTDKV